MSSTNSDSPEEKPRRAYEAPRIEESGTFERLVLACGHIGAGQPGGGGPCDPMEGGSINS